MSDDGYGYDCDDGYGYDDGGDFSYDEPYHVGESYDVGERDAEDYAGDSTKNNFNEDDSPSYDYRSDGAAEGDGPQDAEGYPPEELEVGSDEATYSSGRSSGERSQEEAESSYRRASGPNGGPYRSSPWGEYSYKNSGVNSAGEHYCVRDYGPGTSNSYHYANKDGSYYYKNLDGSEYYNDGNGFSSYTPAEKTR